MTSATPRPYSWPPTWFTNLLGRRVGASVFVIEAWVGKRWQPIARSDYEASARRLFNQASYVGDLASPAPWLRCLDQDARRRTEKRAVVTAVKQKAEER